MCNYLTLASLFIVFCIEDCIEIKSELFNGFSLKSLSNRILFMKIINEKELKLRMMKL
jgi:hypothetical protein